MKVQDALMLGTLTLRLGPRRVALNALHRWRIRARHYEKKCPTAALRMAPAAVLSDARAPFHRPDAVAVAGQLRAAVCAAADRIVQGELQFFGHLWQARPASWRSSVLTGYTTPLDHWSKLSDFDVRVGDVKWIWDASRFDWAYVLGRAWAYSGEEKYAETFWTLLEDWIADNPVNAGLNWKCGQECGLRLLALSWSAGTFGAARATSRTRLDRLWSLVTALAERVRTSLVYSISQNNNHLLTESLALYVAATALPRHPQAADWHAAGRRHFLRAVLAQFAPDGYYTQHSWTYSRFGLRTVLIFLALARYRGDRLPDTVIERAGRAVDLMRTMLDPATGRLPNYGGNDGSNVAAMNSCDYLDFRPIVAALLYVLRGERAFEDPAVNEELLWIDAADTAGLRIARRSRGNAHQSGYFRLDSAASRVYLRCGEYRTRPAHADMLHADVWFGHENVARDAGSYQYFDQRGWGVALEGSAAHNVVTIDGKDQMRRYSRFLWAQWARGRALKSTHAANGNVHWVGEHDGYRRLGVVHRREVLGRNDNWLVIDHILRTTRASRSAELRWHLDPQLAWQATGRGLKSAGSGLVVEIAMPAGAALEVLEGEANLPEGGESLYFGELRPRTTLKASARSSDALRFVTSIGRHGIHSPEWTALWGDQLDALHGSTC